MFYDHSRRRASLISLLKDFFFVFDVPLALQEQKRVFVEFLKKTINKPSS